MRLQVCVPRVLEYMNVAHVVVSYIHKTMAAMTCTCVCVCVCVYVSCVCIAG